MKCEIKDRLSGSVLFSMETDSLKLCVEAAVKFGANLTGAYLTGAKLAGANLTGAYLAGADGGKLTLIGERPSLQLGPLGSRCAYLLAFLTDGGVYIRAGCFWNTLTAFKAAVRKTHGTTIHGKEYAVAIAMIEAHAKLWKVKK